MTRHHIASDGWDWTALRRICRHEAHRLLHDPHDAEDAAQESLLRAWRLQHSCRQPEDPGAWTRQIARREALRLIDRRRGGELGRTADHLEDMNALPAPAGPDVDARLDVRRALRCLSPEDQLLVHARYVFDLTQPAAAGLLGMPEGTAKVRLHRARGRLRKLLGGPGTALLEPSV